MYHQNRLKSFQDHLAHSLPKLQQQLVPVSSAKKDISTIPDVLAAKSEIPFQANKFEVMTSGNFSTCKVEKGTLFAATLLDPYSAHSSVLPELNKVIPPTGEIKVLETETCPATSDDFFVEKYFGILSFVKKSLIEL